MTRLTFLALVPIFSVVVLFVSYHAGLDTGQILSPQGCRMSWMSPSYIQQAQFDTSWSPLANRYSLWLYREVGWEPNQVHGVPVLFIPGNAGSSRQVRSIASSATRQFYSSPYEIAPDFRSGTLKPLDFFAVEFNEDLSAFHGPTIDSQVAYSSRAISYILSRYPANTTIIIMGHSMGGIVATSLLPSKSISAIITMSAPHILPPARFDSRIDKIYATNLRALLSDPTPILSLCGGATDLTIPSESCVLPSVNAEIFRRTVFTSALEGAWTGVGHLEMVWCHQIRWRVARAALELGASNSTKQKAVILDQWLHDGRTHALASLENSSVDETIYLTDPSGFDRLRTDAHLALEKPQSSWTYTLPVPSASLSTAKFILLLSQGSIPPVSPQNPLPLRVSVFLCVSAAPDGTSQNCSTLKPTALKLIPNPITGQTFPVPNEGTDESEGVVLYEADVPRLDITAQKTWVGVRTEGADGRGWLVAGFSEQSMHYDVSTSGLLLGRVSFALPDRITLRTQISFPNLLSSALIVYRLSPTSSSGRMPVSACPDRLLPPLVTHTSQPSETHFFPFLSDTNQILLHTHGSAPYTPTSGPTLRGVNLTIYSTGPRECSSDITGFDINIDGWATLGRLATRYPTTLLSWAVGVVALITFGAWGICDAGAPMPTVHQSLARFSLNTLPKLLLCSFLVSYVPLPESYYLGNRGEPLFALLGPVLVVIAAGLVFISWWVLLVLMWPLRKLGIVFSGSRRESTNTSVGRSTMISMALIMLLIFLFVPWQVAYLGCWVIHLFTCASSSPSVPITGSSLTPAPPSPRGEDEYRDTESPLSRDHEKGLYSKANDHHHIMHLLLLMTWLLPLAAPVLAVWVRTLMTAGLTTPFDGDHFFPNVSPFLILVDFASWTAGPLFVRPSYEKWLSVRWSLIILAFTAFFIGPRKAYLIFDVAKVAVGLMVVIRIGPRYWGGTSWYLISKKVS